MAAWVTADGVFYSGDDGEARPVCSPLEILARTRDDKGHNWGLLVEFDESRFTRWESTAAKIDEHGPRTIDRLGFRKTTEHGIGDSLHTTITFYVLPEAWRSEVFRGMNITAVNRELIERGVLQTSKGGKASCSVRLPGMGVQRCYVVLSERGADGALDEAEAA